MQEKTTQPISAADHVSWDALRSCVASTLGRSDKKILVLKNVYASWVDRDLLMLQRHFEVDVFHATKSSVLYSLEWVNKVRKCDTILAWFGSLHFFPIILLAYVLRKKIVVIAGGYDVDRVPEINYGAFCHPWWSRALRKMLFSMTSKVLAVSKSTQREAVKNVGLPKQKVELIYHGFDLPSLKVSPWCDRRDQIVMISSADDGDFRVKGLDQLLAIAERMPRREFILVGRLSPKNLEQIKQRNLKNLELRGFLPYQSEDFESVLSESKIVIQLSYCESFGAAVVDAGLRGCYPIVYSQFALTEVVDQIGTAITYGDHEALSFEIERVLSLPTMDVEDIQQKFFDRFHIVNRENALFKALNF